MAGRLMAWTTAWMALALASPAPAAEIRLLSTNAAKTVLGELGPQFEKTTEHKVVITWGTAAALKAQIEKGTAVDLALLTDSGVEDLIKQGKLKSRVAFASSGIGVAIKRGAPKPDLGSTEAFKKMLLDAKSIAWVEQGASGIYLKGLFERLGIADQIKGKLKSVAAATPAVANGEAEIGFTQIAEILPYPGAEVAGPLPTDLQLTTVFAFGVGAQPQDAKAVEALVAFLTTPAAKAVIKAKGLDPR
jgi:molybdate transport system substrate-binding protein